MIRNRKQTSLEPIAMLTISHHVVALFERYADRIYEFIPDGANGVRVRLLSEPPAEADGHSLASVADQ
jgi:hypothetical protein